MFTIIPQEVSKILDFPKLNTQNRVISIEQKHMNNLPNVLKEAPQVLALFVVYVKKRII